MSGLTVNGAWVNWIILIRGTEIHPSKVRDNPKGSPCSKQLTKINIWSSHILNGIARKISSKVNNGVSWYSDKLKAAFC